MADQVGARRAWPTILSAQCYLANTRQHVVKRCVRGSRSQNQLQSCQKIATMATNRLQLVGRNLPPLAKQPTDHFRENARNRSKHTLHGKVIGVLISKSKNSVENALPGSTRQAPIPNEQNSRSHGHCAGRLRYSSGSKKTVQAATRRARGWETSPTPLGWEDASTREPA